MSSPPGLFTIFGLYMSSFPALSALGAASALLLFASTPSVAAARADGPSFNCQRATSDSEKAICANPELASLDRRIAARYTALRGQLEARAFRSLREDQEWFVASREETAIEDLADTLRSRLSFLNAIRLPPASGVVGNWRNAAGMITVTQEPSGGVTFEANAAAPVTGRWVCGASGDVIAAGQGRWNAVISDPVDDTITFERRGSLLVVVEPQTSREYCGLNGGLAGFYFPAAPEAQ